MIENKILEIAKNYTKSKKEITLESRFKEDLKIDSLSLVEFIIECEDTFEIEIDLDDHMNMPIKTLKDLQDAILWIKNS